MSSRSNVRRVSFFCLAEGEGDICSVSFVSVEEDCWRDVNVNVQEDDTKDGC